MVRRETTRETTRESVTLSEMRAADHSGVTEQSEKSDPESRRARGAFYKIYSFSN